MSRNEQSEKETLKKKLEGKTLKQKLRYFWDYHKWKVILPLLALIVITSLISTYKEETKPLALYIAIVNGADTVGAEVKFLDEYPEACGIDTKAQPVRVESRMVHPRTMDDTVVADQMTVASMQKYQGMLINGDMDVTVTTDWAVDEYMKADAYLDLEKFLPDELKESLKGRFYYTKDSKGQQVAAGICLESAEWGTYYEDAKPILVVSSYSERQENAIQFIDWITKEDIRHSSVGIHLRKMR